MKVAVCDDEEIYRAQLMDYLTPYADRITPVVFASGTQLISAYDAGELFDIIILDIEIGDIDGVQVARHIRKIDTDAIIIFVTSYITFVSDTFRVGAFQFLIKPIKREDFCRDFEHAMEAYRLHHFKYLVKWKDSTSALMVSDILYIEGYGRHLFVTTDSQRLECIGKLSAEEEKLRPYQFVRCHQGYLVNMNHIRLINKTSILLTNGDQVPMSKHLAVKVKDAFSSYMAGCCI